MGPEPLSAEFDAAAFAGACGKKRIAIKVAMLDQAVGPNIIKRLNAGLDAFLEAHADKGWHRIEDFRGARRDRVVLQSAIRRPNEADYHAGFEAVEGYAS